MDTHPGRGCRLGCRTRPRLGKEKSVVVVILRATTTAKQGTEAGRVDCAL